MGAGFYMMVAVSIIIFRMAVADNKSGWIWAGINVCISMLLGKYFGLGILLAVGYGLITFFVMFIFNVLSNKKLD